MENIIIDIKSTIKQIDGDENIIELTTCGELFNKNGSIYIVYYESDMSGMEGCKTVLKITGNIIIMTRFGKSTTKIIFDKEVPMNSIYATPYGDFKMEVSTSQMDVVINPEELKGKVSLAYNMVLENLSSSYNELNLGIKKLIKE